MKRFFAIDFETATQERSTACSLAIIEVVNNVIVSQHMWMFQPPGNSYSSINSTIHGINANVTKDLPYLSNFYEDIYELLDGNVVIAHNASFDMSVLEDSLAVYNLSTPIPSEICCTMDISGGKKLKELCEEFNIDLIHHDPLSDAKACAICFLKFKNQKLEVVKTGSKAKILSQRANMPTDGRQTFTGEILASPVLDTIENKDTIFYNKKVVITGTFYRYENRIKLAELIKGYGGDIQSTISKKTNIVIAGQGFGPKKMEKVKHLQGDGVGINLMLEDDIYNYLDKL